jgi:hypothetical protein
MVAIPPDVLRLALDMREVTNIHISVFSLVMTILFTSYVGKELWLGAGIIVGRKSSAVSFLHELLRGFRFLSFSSKGALGLACLSFGEFLRSSTVWKILHFDRTTGTYASQIAPLTVALILIIIGSLCVIRIFSPQMVGHWLWIASLAIAITLATVSMLLR